MSSSPLTPPPMAPGAPEAPSVPSFFSSAFVTPSSEVTVALVLAILSGIMSLLVYAFIREWMNCYQKRMQIEDLEYKARPLKLKGLQRLYAHFWPLFLVTEEEVLKTAGLDAMVLLRTMVLGIQLFWPLSVLGCVVLLPITLSGVTVDMHTSSGIAFGTSLMYFSMANIRQGSHLFWIFVVVIMVFYVYALWLLQVHYRSITMLRVAYLTETRPLRPRGDYGAMHLVGDPSPPHRERMGDGLGRGRRAARVIIELVNPIATYFWSVDYVSKPLLFPSTAGSLGSLPPTPPSGPPTTNAAGAGEEAEVALQTGASLQSEGGPDFGLEGRPSNHVAKRPSLGPRSIRRGEGSFHGHRKTWNESYCPLLKGASSSTAVQQGGDGGREETALHPWWLEQDQQSEDLLDDSNVVLLGKTAVNRRQTTPAVSLRNPPQAEPDVKVLVSQYAVLIRLSRNSHCRNPAIEALLFHSDLPFRHLAGLGSEGKHGLKSRFQGSFSKEDPFSSSKGTRGARGKDIEGGEKQEGDAKGRKREAEMEEVQRKHAVWCQQQADELHSFYMSLYPDSFQALVPIFVHQKVDGLIVCLDLAMGALEQHREMARRMEDQEKSASDGKIGKGGGVKTTTDFSPSAANGAVKRRAAGMVTAPGKEMQVFAASSTFNAAPSSIESRIGGRDPLEEDREVGGGHADPVEMELAARVHDLEKEVLAARREALEYPCGLAYIVLFNSQKDALVASRCPPTLMPGESRWGDGLAVPPTGADVDRSTPLPPTREGPSPVSGLWSYVAEPAPAPEDVNWQSLWTPSPERLIRRLLMLIPLALAFLFPIGVITGSLTNLQVSLCSGTPQTNSLYWPGFCNLKGFWGRLAKDLLTGLVPSVLNTFFDTYVMPLVFYFIIQAERSCSSMSGLDRRVSSYFYYYDVFNGFLMVVLSGGTVAQIGAALNNDSTNNTTHESMVTVLGQALVGACNFFFCNIIWKTFFTNVFRYVWPHDGTVLFVLIRYMGLKVPKCDRDRMVIRTNPGFRGGRHYGALMMVFIPGLCYGVINPVILPLCLGYFLTAWIAWKYAIVYFYERSHESGGQMFEQVYDHIINTLYLAAGFTSIVLLSQKAWWCALVVFVVLPSMLQVFTASMESYRYNRNVPLEFLARAPKAVINPLQYVPTALRNGAVGWYPDGQRVWEKYGIPRYV